MKERRQDYDALYEALQEAGRRPRDEAALDAVHRRMIQRSRRRNRSLRAWWKLGELAKDSYGT